MDRKFDLNVEVVLEDWEVFHAIREIIANAIDEQLLTDTKDIEIRKENNSHIIRDYGRGIKYEHFTQNEDKEKISRPELVIGKFGVGLKDALATFDRHNISIVIKSKYGDITMDKSTKHGFEDITTLHAIVSPASDSEMVGTEVIMNGCTDEDVKKAKALFLKFSDDQVMDKTQYGDILKGEYNAGSPLSSQGGEGSRIYINGVKVAEEDNFLFSYNITSLNSTMRKALNRERTNIGRTAYSDRVKSILLASNNEKVAQMLADDLAGFSLGTMHDELKYTDVGEHATKISNAKGNALFVTPDQLEMQSEIVDQARREGINVTIVPSSIGNRIQSGTDIRGNPMRDVGEYNREINASFKFDFIEPEKLNPEERAVFALTTHIFNLIGGKPRGVKNILISKTMRVGESGMEVVGLWVEKDGNIIIKRGQLADLADYAGTLLHEAAHALCGDNDMTREFELELTDIIGKIAAEACRIQSR